MLLFMTLYETILAGSSKFESGGYHGGESVFLVCGSLPFIIVSYLDMRPLSHERLYLHLECQCHGVMAGTLTHFQELDSKRRNVVPYHSL